MIAYNNTSSGVSHYEIGDTYIRVRFKTGDVYTYTYSSCSRDDVELMKILAASQDDLNTFINQHKPKYGHTTYRRKRDEGRYFT